MVTGNFSVAVTTATVGLLSSVWDARLSAIRTLSKLLICRLVGLRNEKNRLVRGREKRFHRMSAPMTPDKSLARTRGG